MINNKGQTLIMFVVFLPLLVIIMATVIDVSTMYQNKNKLDDINRMVISYALDNLDDESLESNVIDLIKENDNKINIDSINISDNSVQISFHKNIKSTFGKIIGLDEYKIVSNYIGKFNENKKEIKKG